MKFSINRSSFLKTFADVSRAISSKTTIPVLTGLKLVATTAGLTLTGSDADISIEATIPEDSEDNTLTIQEPGAIILPARFFGEIVKRLPEDNMTVTIEDLQATITSGASEFTINGLDAATYPQLPEISSDRSLTLKADTFRQIIGQTVIAVSTQESRPILTGVHISIQNGTLVAVATDSHRLAQRSIDLEGVTTDADFIIPGRSLTELGRMLTDDVTETELRIADNQVLFTIGQTSFYSRLLDGNYPDTTRLIPTTSNTRIEFSAPALLAAINRASLMSHEGRNNVVRLNIEVGAGQVTLFGNSPEIGNVEEQLSFNALEGEDLEISFNPDYMKVALQGLGQSTIEVAFTAPLRPFTLVPSEDKEHYIQLITPVRTF
ncbi:DNA polymerase III subunit beta [Lacticaseibacillus sharpeae]|uniref:Beta sliding clamp n=1 Tax=Lacticaseibacillus sharpeae JCM 1186 = DSM 20505 TaxID=1291052 RepID=A0A0R1ZXD2_9LACO|nr:DNA polymerase III subunit beta [Lacticaseibacillus sharpeae]KRM55580.1 DNA-directed DNA polymerase [Lacticaseibacillus sharpeae JCM 1186 = DSM 20505]